VRAAQRPLHTLLSYQGSIGPGLKKKGANAEPLGPYNAEFRAGFDRKITEWACDFITRSKEAGKPFYIYLPYTMVHNPTIPDPEYVGKTKRGNWA
jgi:hypothetical protein